MSWVYGVDRYVLPLLSDPDIPTWGPIYESGSLQLTLRPFEDSTDVTLADEDTMFRFSKKFSQGGQVD